MRAAVFREMSKPLVIETVPDPVAGAHDVILKVKNCGICGSDLHMTEPSSAMPLALGSVMGHEFAGEVVEVGSAVKHLWKSGDRLAGFPVICCGDHTPCINFSTRGTCANMLSVGLGAAPGAYAEFIRIGASSGYKLPANVTFREGAERNKAMAVYASMTAAGGASGLVLGGLLVQFESWRWVFFVNVPIGLLTIAVTPFVLPVIGAEPAVDHPRANHHRLRQRDPSCRHHHRGGGCCVCAGSQ